MDKDTNNNEESKPSQHLYTHLDDYQQLHHSNAANKTTSKIVLVTVVVSVLLAIYTLYYTDYIVNLSHIDFSDFSVNNRFAIYGASLFFIHVFFGAFSFLCATTR